MFRIMNDEQYIHICQFKTGLIGLHNSWVQVQEFNLLASQEHHLIFRHNYYHLNLAYSHLVVHWSIVKFLLCHKLIKKRSGNIFHIPSLNLFTVSAVRLLISPNCHSAPECICIECVHVCGPSPQSVGIGAEATWWITGRWWEEAQPRTASPLTASETSSFVISPSGPVAETILEVLFWEHK